MKGKRGGGGWVYFWMVVVVVDAMSPRPPSQTRDVCSLSKNSSISRKTYLLVFKKNSK